MILSPVLIFVYIVKCDVTNGTEGGGVSFKICCLIFGQVKTVSAMDQHSSHSSIVLSRRIA